MKLLGLLVLFFSQFAWSQFDAGTVMYADFEPDEITIAADSRTTTGTGRHDDTECKISAFGPKFIFSLAGIVRKEGQWNAHSVARHIWELESKTGSDTTLLTRVVAHWIEAMEPLYRDPSVINDLRKHVTEEPVVATAFFAALGKDGVLQATAVDIDFDLRLFDSTGKISLIHDLIEVPAQSSISGGHDEIVIEFRHETTQRAKDYMRDFKASISGLPLNQQRADLAKKLIELSILLNNQSSELAYPVDVLQLDKGTGVRWIKRKPNCPEQ